ncbi:hypothetical protein N8T08_003696 [Aspergillus melleus]|uniref:Uncharacterized protein n=1 Tax=Aspergillus melleus TaxID=138277 RepID=A0ACC3B6X0_9EURO|nr:hypothetical protein N8T08_003696 [Aspergillus melleus]
MKIYGRHMSPNEHWKTTRSAQAYKSSIVPGVTNFGIVFGPNAFPANNSVIYANEVQVEYIVKTIFQPILSGHFTAIDVKEASEVRDANTIQEKLKTMVWSAGCSNWNLDANGRNTTNYPDNTWKFWYQLYWPEWEDFNFVGDTGRRSMSPLQSLSLMTMDTAGMVLGVLLHVFLVVKSTE